MEISPRVPEGILDMRGPRTLEGGYSPSQVMSSAMEREEEKVGVLVDWMVMAERGMGANAADMAMIAERRKKVSLAILIIWIDCEEGRKKDGLC